MFKKLRTLGFCAVLLLGLSACEGVTIFGGGDEFSSFAKSPVTGIVSSEEEKVDRETARATFRQGAVDAGNLARDFGDEIGAKCYDAIRDYIDSKPEIRVIEVQQALVVLQRARLGLKRLNETIPEELIEGCAAMYVDMKLDVDDFNAFLGMRLLLR